MTTKIKGIPENSSVVIPRLVCRNPASEIEFCVNTFKAVELSRRPGPDGAAAHALLMIGPQMLMIEAVWPTLPSRAPELDGSSSVLIFVYVEDVDQTVAQAIEYGAQIITPLQNQFWGDRMACVMDPAGHVWTIASRIEETTEEERADRWANIVS